MTESTGIIEPQITETLPSITLNIEELERWARGVVEPYQGLVVTEDQVPAIKSEMAALNKVKDKLETARKEAVRRVSAPIREFEDRIKAVTAIIVEARSGLDMQVKAFEERQRADKQREVEFLIRDTLDQHKVPGLEIQIQAAWLNKSTPLKTVKAEVEAMILGHIQREREIAELERARQDRALAVENHLAAQNLANGTAVPVAMFQNQIAGGAPLADVLAEVTAYCAAQRERNEHITTPRVAVPAPAPVMQPVTPGAKPPRRMAITATYDAVNAGRVRDAVQQLRALCTSFDINVVELETTTA
jgi:hypothetical protein